MQVTYVLDVHVCVSGLQVKGDWQVKCYAGECGVNRNCRTTRHRKSEQNVRKPTEAGMAQGLIRLCIVYF